MCCAHFAQYDRVSLNLRVKPEDDTKEPTTESLGHVLSYFETRDFVIDKALSPAECEHISNMLPFEEDNNAVFSKIYLSKFIYQTSASTAKAATNYCQ